MIENQILEKIKHFTPFKTIEISYLQGLSKIKSTELAVCTWKQFHLFCRETILLIFPFGSWQSPCILGSNKLLIGTPEISLSNDTRTVGLYSQFISSEGAHSLER